MFSPRDNHLRRIAPRGLYLNIVDAGCASALARLLQDPIDKQLHRVGCTSLRIRDLTKLFPRDISADGQNKQSRAADFGKHRCDINGVLGTRRTISRDDDVVHSVHAIAANLGPHPRRACTSGRRKELSQLLRKQFDQFLDLPRI